MSGGGDKFLRVWDINTGEQLACLEAHSRGISSLSVDFGSASSRRPQTKDKQSRHIATIATGSSDASVKTFSLLADFSTMCDSERMRVEGSQAPSEAAITARLYLKESHPCVAPCSCPPGLSRMDGYRCGRCLNRGHTDLVRGLSINRDVMLSASYDGNVRVSTVKRGPCAVLTSDMGPEEWSISGRAEWRAYWSDLFGGRGPY